MNKNILIVEDEPVQAKMFGEFVKKDMNHNVIFMSDGQQVLDFFLEKKNDINHLMPRDIDVMIIDLSMPKVSGMEVLKRIFDIKGDLQIIVITATNDTSVIINAINFGAIDYIVKGEKDVLTRLTTSLCNAIEKKNLKYQVYNLERRTKNQVVFSDIIGVDREFLGAINLAKKVSNSIVPVLIEGPSGTGKELLARAIHGSGPRSGKPFIIVDCAQLEIKNATEILFGHERKSDDGLVEKSVGKIKEAMGGTLFLDDIGSLQSDVQIKLLRFLQEGQFQPNGSKIIYRSTARVISSSKHDLVDLVRKKQFREDLLYRLNIFPIKLPSLLQRGVEDIKLLAENFCHNASVNENKKVKGISDNTMKLLLSYEWEDNIRQLKNYIFRAVVLCDEEYLEPRHFPQIIMIENQSISLARLSTMIRKTNSTNSEVFDIFDISGKCKSLEDIEYEVVERLYHLYNGNLSEISKKLKVSRSTIYRKLDLVNKDKQDVQEG